MPERRRRFSPQFKAEAVQMVLETGRSIAEVARDLGIHDGTLGNWVNGWRREHPEPDQTSDAGGARARERTGRRDPAAADGERVPEKVIEAEKANFPIAWMCRQLNVPRSSFYAWRAQADTVTATAARRRALAELVAKIFDDSRGTYGCRPVAAQLNRQGHPASVGLVADLMRELDLVACQPRSYKTTTVAGEDPVASPDLIEREFTAPAPGQRLVGDITYLRTGERWLHLATVIDLATRPERVLADKGYSHPSTRAALRARRIAFTSPERIDQIERRRGKGSRGGRPPAFDPDVYADRNVVERCSTGSSSSATSPLATPNEPPTTGPRSSSPPSSYGTDP